MKALLRNLAIFALSFLLLPGCGTDTDGDGTPDAIVNVGQDGQQIDPLLEATAGANAVDMGDFNNDGFMDFVSVSSENQPVQLHMLNAEGRFDMISIAGGGPLAIMKKVLAVDLNLDGRLDIAVLVKDTGFAPPKDVDMSSALVLLIQGADPLDPADWFWVEPPPQCYGTPDLPECGLFLPSNPTGPTDLEVGDFNGDGLPDLVLTSNQPEPPEAPEGTPHTFVYVFLNPGRVNLGNPAAWTRIVADLDILDFSDLAVTDIDRDGDDDIVATVPTAKTWNIEWLRNSNHGADWANELIGEQSGGGNNIDVGDINGDGSPDVAVSAAALGLVQWFRSPGPASLGPGAPQVPWYVYNVGLISDITVNGQAQTATLDQLRVIDTDLDGQVEVFASGSGLAFEFQRAENIFNPWSGAALFETDPAGQIGRCDFYDYSGNGRLDVVVPVDRPGLTQDGMYLFTR